MGFALVIQILYLGIEPDKLAGHSYFSYDLIFAAGSVAIFSICLTTFVLVSKSNGSPHGRPNLKPVMNALGILSFSAIPGMRLTMTVEIPASSKARAYSPSTLWQAPQPGTSKAILT
ncbi:hypothetical protein ACJROX_15540 [Pseudalkalibacillus sp. A8]|uniref:hypothetical protein n=1 Tax=Pseudalkalibacillus sp. A8 TaxID=3382641 RepID=UPI0038B509F4